MSTDVDWQSLCARAGLAAHHLIGWIMWDPAAIARYADLGVPDGRGWIIAWRLATLGDVSPAVAASTTYSMAPRIIEFVVNAYRGVASTDDILEVRNASVLDGLNDIAPGLAEELAPLAPALWHGVDSVHFGVRPLFNAHRSRPADRQTEPAVSAWLAVHCLRELRGDNHWALCAAADLDDVEVGLLHSVMVDPNEYGSDEWIARSRGADDERVANGWRRLEAKGWAADGQLTDAGRSFRLELEERTDALTVPAWQAAGAAATTALCEAVEAHQDAFLARVDETAGPRWMPAIRGPR